MIVSFIVAIDEKNGMGKDNHLPWYLPADFKMFKETTKGHCILMGRKTFESLKSPLPDRTNIILTRQKDFQPEGTIIKSSVEEGVEFARQQGESELFVIGGAEIFKQTFPFADKLYITKVAGVFDADTFFPAYDESQWKTVKSEFHEADEKNKSDFTFYIYEKKQ